MQTRATLVQPSDAMSYTLRLSLVYDGSKLAPDDEESEPELHTWTSINDRERVHAIEWADATELMSAPLTVDVDFTNERDDDDAAASSAWRLDTTLWFGALAQSPNHGQVNVRQNVGSAFVYLRDLLDFDAEQPIRLSLGLFNHTDEKGRRYEKGRLLITSVKGVGRVNSLLARHADRTLFAAAASPFEYVPQNAALLHSAVRSVVQRAIFAVTDEAETLGLAIQPAVDFVRRVHAPFFNTTAGMLPGAFYWTVPRQYKFRESSEQWAHNLVKLALKRRNRSEQWLADTLSRQLADTKAPWVSDAFVEAVEVIGTALCITSTSLPYTGDRTDINRRDDVRFVSSANVHPAESFDSALLRRGGDCEDLGRTEHECYYVLLKGLKQHADTSVPWKRRGSWSSELLQSVQRVLHLYVGTGNLGSVLAAALGNSNGTAKETQYIIDTAHDANVKVGAHMWYELVPQRKFVALIKRTTPNVDESSLLDPAMIDAPWTWTLPHLLLEGTGRLMPLQLPRVAYCSPYDDDVEKRKRVRDEDEARQATLKRVMESEKIFQAFEVERYQTKTKRVPDARVNKFYRRTTYAYTPYLIERGWGVAHLMYVNVGERVKEPTSELYSETGSVDGVAIGAQETTAATQERALHTFIGDSETGERRTGIREKMIGLKSRTGQQITYGVNLADKLRQEPGWPAHVALLPGPPIEEVEAAAIASFIRQLKPNAVPDVRMATMPKASEKRLKRVENRVKFVAADETREQQRTFDTMQDAVRNVFSAANEQWPKETPDKHTVLTLFFKEYDLLEHGIAEAVADAVARQKLAGLVVNARVYKEVPIENIENGVLQLLCRTLRK